GGRTGNRAASSARRWAAFMLLRGYQSVSFARVASVHEHVPASTVAGPGCSAGPSSSGSGSSAMATVTVPAGWSVRAMVHGRKATYGHFVRVLICDDEPDIRSLYRYAFEQAGADVDEAKDGNDVIEVAIRVKPDLVILDLLMP